MRRAIRSIKWDPDDQLRNRRFTRTIWTTKWNPDSAVPYCSLVLIDSSSLRSLYYALSFCLIQSCRVSRENHHLPSFSFLLFPCSYQCPLLQMNIVNWFATAYSRWIGKPAERVNSRGMRLSVDGWVDWIDSLIPKTPFIMVGMFILSGRVILTEGVESC